MSPLREDREWGSAHVARLLDRGEVKLREALHHTRGVWGESVPAVKVLIALTIYLCVVASVYGAYHVFAPAPLAG